MSSPAGSCSSEYHWADEDEDEVMEALLTLGIVKDYFDTRNGTTVTSSISSGQKQVWLCPIIKCTFSTIKLYTFKLHLLKHFNVRPFKCKFIHRDTNLACQWAFYSKSKLRRHQSSHLQTKQFACTIDACARRFSWKDNFLAHMRNHEKALDLRCDVDKCEKKFQTVKQFEMHKREHAHLPAPFKCEHVGCNKSFYSACSLQSHRRAHVNDPSRLVCKECNQQFQLPCRLKEHVESIHNNVRKYKCAHDGCDWAFKTNSKLTRHAKTHANARNFKCPVNTCGQSFLRAEHLREHAQTHLSERARPKFVCTYPECLLTFYARASLYAHVKKVHRAEVHGVKRGKNAVSCTESSEWRGEECCSDIMESLTRDGLFEETEDDELMNRHEMEREMVLVNSSHTL